MSKQLSENRPLTAVMVSQGEIIVPEGEHFFRLIPKNLEEEYIFHLHSPGTNIWVQAAVKAQKTEAPHLKITLIHHAPNTKAETVIHTLASDSSFPHFSGKIKIQPGAFDCESYLNHHSLLLGETAKSWTLPSLEIENNQVKCSHAATLKTLTPEDLFYFKARGISEEVAIQSVVKGFLTLS